MEEYRISANFLDKTINDFAKTLVGKTCKRFEILDNKEDIKNELKELIYEHHRALKNNLISFSGGIKFINKNRTYSA